MRKQIWILASCGIMGAALSLSAADDADSSAESKTLGSLAVPTSLERHVPRKRAVDDAVRLSAAEPQTTLTDPVSTTAGPTEDIFQESSRPQRPARRSAVVPASHESTKSTSSELIHAEYRQNEVDGQKKNIQQVRATASAGSPFDDGADVAMPAASRSKTGRGASVLRVGAYRQPAAPVVHAAATDPMQTPAVTAQWVKKSAISVGQECHCDLVVKNSGRAAAKDVNVDGYFPTTVRLTNAEPMPADHQDHVTWTFATLGAGEERAIHVKLIPSKRGELATTALVRFTQSAANVFVVEEPMLNLAVRGPRDLMVGDPATQSITVSNPGTGVAHNVKVEARVSKGLEHPRGEKLTVEVGSLNPGESRLVRLPLVAVAGGEQTVTIHASSGAELHQQLASRINVIAPSVKVAIEGPGMRYVGRNAAYLVTVTNDGGAASNNVRISHKLPEGFKFLRADKGGEYDDSSRTVSWFIGHLESKESAQLKCELATKQIGTHVHSVAAVTEQGARAESKLETVVDGNASLEVEIIDQNDPVEVGAETAYEIHIRNDGSKAAQNVGLTCELPAAVELLRAEGVTEGRQDGALVTFRPLSSLEPGKAAIYRVHVRGRAEGSHRFRTRLSADGMKEPLIHEELTKFYAE